MTQLRPNKRDTPRFYSTSIKLIEPSPPRLLSFQILSIFLSPSLSTIKIDGNRAVRREGLVRSAKDKKIIWRWSTNAIDFWIYVGFHVSCFFLSFFFFFLSFPNRRISLNVPLRVLTMHRASAESEIATAPPLPVASINIYVFLTLFHARWNSRNLIVSIRPYRSLQPNRARDWYQLSRNRLDNYLELISKRQFHFLNKWKRMSLSEPKVDIKA